MIKSRLRARAKKMIKSNAQEQEQEEVDLKEAAFVLIKTKIEQSQHQSITTSNQSEQNQIFIKYFIYSTSINIMKVNSFASAAFLVLTAATSITVVTAADKVSLFIYSA